MSKKEKLISEAISKDLVNDYQNKQFLNEVGHKAIIQRQTVETGQLQAELRAVLEDIGKDIQNLGEIIPKGMEYCGSMAVHIYKAPITGMVAYYNQLSLANCPEALAGPAVSDLRNSAIEHYRPGKAQRKRSGF